MIEHILSFTLALWLGVYLINRDLRSVRMWLAGASLAMFAFVEALALFSNLSLMGILPFVSAVLWVGALFHFLRGEQVLTQLHRLLLLSALPLFMLQGIVPSLIISLALCLPALTAAAIDAEQRGEALIPDLLRSFDFAAFMSLIFGGQVAFVMSLVGVSEPLLLLLLGTITASILVQGFSDQAQSIVERVAFFRWARLRSARADLRAVANALPRTTDLPNTDQLSEDEFVRYTRRALSHFGDLPHLLANPLIYLPAIDARLVQRRAPDNTLERAVELKALVSESIARLKPRDKGDFGTTNEWRHYNALYYPYIVGLKPYSVRTLNDYLDEDAHEALNWFNTSVPERTLYNWQTAATKLVAQDLRERQQEAESV